MIKAYKVAYLLSVLFCRFSKLCLVKLLSFKTTSSA